MTIFEGEKKFKIPQHLNKWHICFCPSPSPRFIAKTREPFNITVANNVSYHFSQVYPDKCSISNNLFQSSKAFIKLYFISL